MESRPGTPLGRCDPTVQRHIIYHAPPLSIPDDSRPRAEDLELATPTSLPTSRQDGGGLVYNAPPLSPPDDSLPYAEDPELKTPTSSPTSLCFPAQDPGVVPTTPTPSQPSSLRPLSPGHLLESYSEAQPGNKRKPSPIPQVQVTVRKNQAVETPEKRANNKASLSSGARSRASEASQKATLKQEDDGHLYCVATGMQDGMLPLEFSHVLPLGTSHEVMTKLEWAWDMGYGHLNLGSRYNIQILTEALHTLFDHRTSFWFWLPTDVDLIQDIYSCYVGEDNKAIDGRFDIAKLYPSGPDEAHCFEYALVVPSFLRKSFAFFRFHGDSPETPDDKAKSITYEPISTIHLHLSPHFVIFDVGRKLQARYKDVGAEGWQGIRARLQEEAEFKTGAYWDILRMCYEIYGAWMRATPSVDFDKVLVKTLEFRNLTAANFVGLYREAVKTAKKTATKAKAT